MNTHSSRLFKLLLLISFLLLLSSCTAGDPQFTQDSPAGFWYGLWHGIIAVITLIIHVFNENVGVYEKHRWLVRFWILNGGYLHLGWQLSRDM